jgi:hypothetical protein
MMKQWAEHAKMSSTGGADIPKYISMYTLANKFSPLQHIGNFMQIIFVAADKGV